jgi:two-component system, NarL family, sensor histidine kinase EvgS
MQAVTDTEMTAIRDKWSYIQGIVRLKPFAEKIVLSSTETGFLEKHGIIRMCVDPDWMPFERINQISLHEGIAADFVQLMATRLGISIKLVQTSNWEESKKIISFGAMRYPICCGL